MATTSLVSVKLARFIDASIDYTSIDISGGIIPFLIACLFLISDQINAIDKLHWFTCL